jgi:hypothetical protein
MSRKDQLLRILAQLDGHFAADKRREPWRCDNCSPADADRWRALKRHIARTKDALDLARIELERTAPETGKALDHIQWGLGAEK